METQVEEGGQLNGSILYMHDDNEAMIAVCRTGKNPTMRHLRRTHGVSISFLHQETRKPYVKLGYIITDSMAADIFTKFYSSRKVATWNAVRQLIGVLSAEETLETPGAPGKGWENASLYPGRYETRKTMEIEEDEDEDEEYSGPVTHGMAATHDLHEDCPASRGAGLIGIKANGKWKNFAPITVGTDVSGIDTPIYAMKEMGGQIPTCILVRNLPIRKKSNRGQ